MSRAGRALFVATILAGSFLLFLVQPLVARMALPRLGGAPAVWNSAMLVYQALLLGGYAYAHWLGRFAARTQAVIHVALLLVAALWLPLGLIARQPSPNAELVLWVPWLLCLSIGPLFFAISAQAPLLQRWFAHADATRDPYALYAASNIGSFAGLIAYPLIVEPGLTVTHQRWLWSAGYVAVALFVAACGVRLPAGEAAAVAPPRSIAPTRSRVAWWIALALVPSGLMLATSTYITTDIVAMQLLWVLPLGLYLLSFSVAFATDRRAARAITRVAPWMLLIGGGWLIGGVQITPLFDVALALALLFVTAVAIHGEMYRLRPAADRLTGFYLAMSVGGVLGGIFAALIAPIVFDWTWEYPILIVAAGAMVPRGYVGAWAATAWSGAPRKRRILTLASMLAMGLLILAVLNKPGAPIDRSLPGEAAVFVLVAAIGYVAMGGRTAFAVAVAGAMIAFGGFRAMLPSLEPGMR
ncbi:MAG: hypothetical protein M3R41_06300, partial [Pseudomonadota bacterium]|nr:hypothetical protein [Pseudomonadota bacterium]